MYRSHRLLLACSGLVALALLGGAPARAVEAGITMDVHQDVDNPALWPNDFHVEGMICSHGTPPVLLQHIDALFPHFTYTITKVNPADPLDCWYWFEATWWLDPGIYIPYCTILHMGLLFDVDSANVIIDLVGWWTRDGMPVGRMKANLANQGYVPLVGFNVADATSPQTLTLANGIVPIAPVLPPPVINPPPWPPAPIEFQILQLDVVPFPPGTPPSFTELREGGLQQSFPWVPVVYADGAPISEVRPLYVAPSSFFDVFLETFGRVDGLHPQTPTPIEPGGFLVVRQLVQFNNNGSGKALERRWFWEIHGAPRAMGACCYGTNPIQCAVVDQLTCLQQLLGQWKGAGTTCVDADGDGVADICEPVDLGACCYGTTAPQCIVTTQALCVQQYLGQWKGVGTTCADLDGDGVADICEPVEVGACCYGTNPVLCVVVDRITCEQQYLGQWHGAGSRCLGDLNGNGVDDICEEKWIQLPDLSIRGIDVKATKPLILADDFQCTRHSLITDIIVWGSWYHDLLPENPLNVKFTLSLHADIPGTPFSRPGNVLWYRVFQPGMFTASQYQGNIQEGWWNPLVPSSYEFPGDTVCWQYYFPVPPAEAFCQLGTPETPIVYWLDVQAEPLGATTGAQFGWKTSIDHWNDAAVFGQGVEPYPGPWNKLTYPAQHPLEGQSIDLAFAIGGNLPCPEPKGACCIQYTCTMMTQANCLAALGKYRGDGTTCATPRICACPGDSNCDGNINYGDINAFVRALNDPSTCCHFDNCDVNGDGAINYGDINPFVVALSHPGPCP
jgi:hypothetical protein